jgi:hypothetical protein
MRVYTHLTYFATGLYRTVCCCVEKKCFRHNFRFADYPSRVLLVVSVTSPGFESFTAESGAEVVGM